MLYLMDHPRAVEGYGGALALFLDDDKMIIFKTSPSFGDWVDETCTQSELKASDWEFTHVPKRLINSLIKSLDK